MNIARFKDKITIAADENAQCAFFIIPSDIYFEMDEAAILSKRAICFLYSMGVQCISFLKHSV